MFVEPVLAELYVLGDRPSADDVRKYLLSVGVEEGDWLRAIVHAWRDRLRKPTKRIRKSGWPYPFVIHETVIAEGGLRSVPDRLIDALTVAAADYIRLATADPSSDETQTAAVMHAITANAVRLWALTRDRIEDRPWPNVMARPRGYDHLAEASTRAGHARHEKRLERWARERDEQEARARELGLLDE